MKNKRISSLSHKEREKVRLQAGKLFKKGVPQAEIARRFKATPAAVSYWHAKWKKKGILGLKSKGPTGFASELTQENKILFKKAIIKGPLQYGYETDLWTLPKLSAVLRKVTGFRCSEVWTWHIVRNLGFTPQKPQIKARERDEKAIAEWKTTTLPGLKKMGRKTWILSSI
jgi:transposase